MKIKVDNWLTFDNKNEWFNEIKENELNYYTDMYNAWQTKQQLVIWREVKGNLSWTMFATIEQNVNQVIPTNIATTIINLWNKVWNTSMTNTANQINIVEDWFYNISAFCFCWWSWNIVFRVLKNWNITNPHCRLWTTTAVINTASINFYEQLSKWDILTMIIYQDSWLNQTIQISRLSVCKA